MFYSINWILKNKKILKKINKGIERETLRIDKNGNLSKTLHPKSLGSSLTHKWITTDFSENLIEFITPKTNNTNKLINILLDLYIYTTKNLFKEQLWPLSIPPYYINNKKKIQIAKYGKSRLGKKKELYRIGLKNRYGYYKNIISGIHYNFSLPKKIWKKWYNTDKVINKNMISKGYMHIIRNYYRFGYIIPYIFGSSPTISNKIIKKKNINFNFSTSIRSSKFVYGNNISKKLNIKFNSIKEYIKKIEKALKTKEKKFKNIKEKKNQINSNLIQLENELYVQVRPKQNAKKKETQIEALKKRGIKYIEIRSLDVNPFSPIGIKKHQILILDLFLIWCLLIKSPFISKIEMKYIYKNWENICIKGKKKKQKIYVKKNKKKKFIKLGIQIIRQLKIIAKMLDKNTKKNEYKKSCKKIIKMFQNNNMTYSSKILKMIKKYGIKKAGLNLSNKYFKKYKNKLFKNIKKTDFLKEKLISLKMNKIIEKHNLKY